MKYIISAVLLLTLLACQTDTTPNQVKNESSALNNPSTENEITTLSKVSDNTLTLSEPEIQTIIFVCEYGFDKSVLAASYFNEQMKNKRLPYIAISRAAKSNKRKMNNIPTAILTDILSTGLTLRSTDVIILSQAELIDAYKVIFLDDLPLAKSQQKLISWNNIPPLKVGVHKTLSAIKEKVDKLVKEIGC